MKCIPNRNIHNLIRWYNLLSLLSGRDFTINSNTCVLLFREAYKTKKINTTHKAQEADEASNSHKDASQGNKGGEEMSLSIEAVCMLGE